MKPIKIIQTFDCCFLFKMVRNKTFQQTVLFNNALKYAIMNVQENFEGLKLTDTHQLLVYTDITGLQAQNGS